MKSQFKILEIANKSTREMDLGHHTLTSITSSPPISVNGASSPWNPLAVQRLFDFVANNEKKNIYDTNHVIARYIYPICRIQLDSCCFFDHPQMIESLLMIFPLGLPSPWVTISLFMIYHITMGHHITMGYHGLPWVTISPWVPMGIYDLPQGSLPHHEFTTAKSQ
jgi:hypothetical protein